jgi:hypothetical protein
MISKEEKKGQDTLLFVLPAIALQSPRTWLRVLISAYSNIPPSLSLWPTWPWRMLPFGAIDSDILGVPAEPTSFLPTLAETEL